MWNQLKTVLQKIPMVGRIIFVVAAIAVVIGLILLVSFSSADQTYILYDRLTETNYERAQDHLDELGIAYSKNDSERAIYVYSESARDRARTALGMNNALEPQPGFEFFRDVGIGVTRVEKQVMLHKEIQDQLRRTLIAHEDIQNATVSISFENDSPILARLSEENPVTASVGLVPAPGSEFTTNKKKIEGLRTFIAYSVKGLKEKNVTIMDNVTMECLTCKIDSDDFGDGKFDDIKHQGKVRKELESEYYNEIALLLERNYPNRYTLAVNMEFNWDQKETQETAFIPTEIRPKDPNNPISKAEMQLEIPVSTQTTEEVFEGPAAPLPEGSPGSEYSPPPGIMELTDRYTRYKKTDTLINNEMSRKLSMVKEEPYRIKKVNVVVTLDGLWLKKVDKNGNYIVKDGKIEREYLTDSITQEKINETQEQIEAYVGILDTQSINEVKVIARQFDRSEEHLAEDQAYLAELEARRTTTLVLLIILGFIILTIVFLWLRHIYYKRKRAKEAELARQKELMRQAALRIAEDESLMLDMSDEDKARMELQENAINMAREKPDQVAQVLRTWMSEE